MRKKIKRERSYKLFVRERERGKEKVKNKITKNLFIDFIQFYCPFSKKLIFNCSLKKLSIENGSKENKFLSSSNVMHVIFPIIFDGLAKAAVFKICKLILTLVMVPTCLPCRIKQQLFFLFGF